MGEKDDEREEKMKEEKRGAIEEISAFSSSFRELVILVSRCFLKWPKSLKIRQNIPYPSTCEREHVCRR